MHDFSIFDKEETVCRKAEETLGYFQPFFTTVAPGSAAGPTHTHAMRTFILLRTLLPFYL